MPFPFSLLPQQGAITAVLDEVHETIEHVRNETDMLIFLEGSTADALLTGRVRVAITTDKELPHDTAKFH